jgi:integrase/recombinase XerD
MDSELALIDVSKETELTESQSNVKRELPKYWTREYIHERLDLIQNPKHKMLATFLWMTGCRISEVIGLTKRDLDFQSYLINIKWLKNRKYNHRSIPMHPNLRSLLQMYCGSLNLEDSLFDISRQRAWQLIQKYFDGHPHQLRHSFAVNWLKCGGDITVLSRMLGHSDIRITMEYLKIVPQDQGKELIKITF